MMDAACQAAPISCWRICKAGKVWNQPWILLVTNSSGSEDYYLLHFLKAVAGAQRHGRGTEAQPGKHCCCLPSINFFRLKKKKIHKMCILRVPLSTGGGERRICGCWSMEYIGKLISDDNIPSASLRCCVTVAGKQIRGNRRVAILHPFAYYTPAVTGVHTQKHQEKNLSKAEDGACSTKALTKDWGYFGGGDRARAKTEKNLWCQLIQREWAEQQLNEQNVRNDCIGNWRQNDYWFIGDIEVKAWRM